VTTIIDQSELDPQTPRTVFRNSANGDEEDDQPQTTIQSKSSINNEEVTGGEKKLKLQRANTKQLSLTKL